MSQNKNVVIDVKNISVAYKSRKKDDYKSLMIDLLQGKRKEKKEKKFWPLKDISFQGYQGEILGIVGANGSGKTTLCKVLTGILAPDIGRLSEIGRASCRERV